MPEMKFRIADTFTGSLANLTRARSKRRRRPRPSIYSWALPAPECGSTGIDGAKE